MIVQLSPFDPAQYLETDEDIAVFLDEALKSGDAGYIAHAVGVIARAKGTTALSRQIDISPEELNQFFSDKGNPSLKTTFAVLEALGIKLAVARNPD
ncbi:MAG TPA: putative addiction module antidote protein [Candidatus Aphodousia gallistercoris]|nr:putative addiction module antidote protein [Candidatus Aphodousia gallistercoris]